MRQLGTRYVALNLSAKAKKTLSESGSLLQ